MMLLRRICFLAVVLFALPVDAAPINSADKIQLVDLGIGVNPIAINNGGLVVGQGNNNQAFLWNQGTYTNLGTLGGNQSYANDINDGGVVVGWSYDSSGKQKSFKWDGVLTNLDSSTTLEGAAEAINNNDEIVGWRTNGTTFKAFGWDSINADGELLFSNEAQSLKALGINNFGEVVGITVGSGNQGFYWNGTDDVGNYSHGIGPFYSPLAGINIAGITAGERQNQAHYRPVDQRNILIGKLLPSDTSSAALGLNDNGIIVGESTHKGFFFDVSSGLLYNANSFGFTDGTFQNILRITDINNGGMFVGVATVNGVEHGFVGSFVPEPSGVLLIVVCVAILSLGQSRP
jgi:probable HAF family extracellular repeat protein